MFSFFEVILNWLSNFFHSIGSLIVDIFINLLNGIIENIANLFSSLASIMPSLSIGSDLITQFPTPHNAICWLTWIFPVDVIFQCTQFYISLYFLKFASGPILRLFKIIQ